MKEDNQHIIHNVRAEINLPETNRHSVMSDRLKESVSRSIQNLEPVLDGISGESLCRMDTLSVEITLSNSRLDQLDEHLEIAIREKIVESVKSVQASEIDQNQNTEPDHLTKEDQYREILYTFLMTGQLPWWAEPEVFTKAERWLEELSSSEWISFARPVFQNRPAATERLTAQFPEPVVGDLIRKSVIEVFGNDQILLIKKEILHFIVDQKTPGRIFNEIQTELHKRIIGKIFSGIAEEILLDELLKILLKFIEDSKMELSGNEKALLSFKNRLEVSGLTDAVKQVGRAWKNIGNLKDDIDGVHLSKKDHGNRSSEEEKKEEEGMQVRSAGLVLLHPFLEPFYKNLGYVEDGYFLNDAAQERAVCLMHYLAAGGEEFPEYELILPKFLCGWPLDIPVNRFMSLTDSEKNESENLLLSCIGHWEALKNTSVEGLRENFLRREGILRKEQFGWSLYVEEKTHDILLVKVPWNLSLVKLKWMDEMLTVHWY